MDIMQEEEEELIHDQVNHIKSITTAHHHDHHPDHAAEAEHMFEKVVTPSDVGKLNRLVIPKQHAEKYFPLDTSSSVENGLVLSFEDRAGKPWRFRYSYWNSSQSYVITKGWSRFVKDKSLRAGDIVSFHRGRDNKDDSARARLFIDWRHRPHHPINAHHHLGYYGHHVGVASANPISIEPVAPKRLRLFGVNMEYSPNPETDQDRHQHQVRQPSNALSPIFPVILPSSNTNRSGYGAEFSHKGKSRANSLSFDLDF